MGTSDTSKDHRHTLRAVYGAHTDEFAKRFEEYFDEHAKALVTDFIQRLPTNGTVLDLGSGPGAHGSYMQEQGLDVLCVDLSPEMVEKCKARGLKAQEGDIENLQLGDAVFDGIWMHTSLLHVPRPYIPGVVASLCDYLKPAGVLGVTVWEGHGEGPREKDAAKYGQRRWYTYFTNTDIRKLFDSHFVVGSCQRTRIERERVSLSYLMESRTH